MTDDQEAQRLAQEVADAKREVDERRVADIELRRREEASRAQEQGRREGLAEAATAKQDEQLLSLQQMYASVLSELKGMNQRLALVEMAVKSWVDTARASGEKTVSSRQFWLGVGAIAATLFVALYGKHL